MSDELDALRAAWRELEPGQDLAERTGEDREMRAFVEWMVRAWNALEIPTAPGLPARAARHRTRHLRRRLLVRALPFAAAAGVVLLLQIRRTDPQPFELARAQPIRPVILADGSIETRAGNVRLILVPDTEPDTRAGVSRRAHDEPTPEPSSPGRPNADPTTENSR